MSSAPREILRHLLAEANFHLRVRATLTGPALDDGEVLQRAVVRSLAIIGEASERLPADLRDANHAVEWRAMARMRGRRIPDCFGVALDIVGRVPQSNIPTLQQEGQRILNAGLPDRRTACD